MLETLQYEQLDPATKAYLRDVRAMKGAGCPGPFYGQSSSRPLWAFLAGIIIAPFLLYVASTSTKGGMAVAMLQTAAILLGGWLVLYAFRRWAANADSFAGWFFYFDPCHVYIGEGESIRIAKLSEDTEISPTGPSGVQFVSPLHDDGFFVNLPNRVQAAFVTDYYAAFDWVNSREEGRWAGLPVAEAGAVAKYLVEADAEPPSVQDTGLRFDAIPEHFEKVGRPKSGMLMYLVIIGVGIASFGLFSAINPGMQDDRAFNTAKENLGKSEEPGVTGAQGLRDYLLIDRNTKHRDEATKLLSELYNKPINQLSAATNTDPILKDGMVKLLDSLRGPDAPAVTINVIDLDLPVPKTVEDAKGQSMVWGLRQMIADGIATHVGKDLITFIDIPRDVEGTSALLDIKFQTNKDRTVSWTAEIRLKPDDKEPMAKSKGKIALGGMGAFNPNPIGFNPQPTNTDLPSALSNDTTDAVYRDIMQKMVGVAPPKATVPVDWE